MSSEESLSKRILILGGNSSLANSFIDLAIENGYEIHLTTRNSKSHEFKEGCHHYSLNISDEFSVSNFLQQINPVKFERIIVLIGQTYDLENNPESLTNYQEYFSSQIANLFFIIRNLINNLSASGRFVTFSSRSADGNSFDYLYSGAKGALQSFTRSISRLVVNDSAIFAVAPSLIRESTMYFAMSPKTKESHIVRSGNLLPYPTEIAIQVWELMLKNSRDLNGLVFPLGVQY